MVKQVATTLGKVAMINRYRCRAYRADELTPFYTCIVMATTPAEALAYVRALVTSMQTPAYRIETDWVGRFGKDA